MEYRYLQNGKPISETVSPSVTEQGDQYDVIVVGLGTAGSIAAIAAAARGLNVLGVERLNAMGGTGTTGYVTGYYFGNRGGLYEEIDQKAANLTGEIDITGNSSELKRYVLEQEALAHGVNLRYESSVIGIYADGRKLRGIRYVSPDGLRDAWASVTIDCTGDAEIAAAAGCSFRQGREADGQGQPFSNVQLILSKGKAGMYYIDSGYVDPTDGNDVSRAILESTVLSTHLKERYEEDPLQLHIAPLLGVREGRFIVGEEHVSFENYLADRHSKEPLFYAYSNIDNHSKDVAFESEAQKDWSVVCSLWGLNFTVPIPLGALMPAGWDGLLAAGRCMALEHDIASCVRMKRDMQKSGEAAAAVAWTAIRLGVPLRETPYSELLPLLREHDCLRDTDQVSLKMTASAGDPQNRDWLQEPEAIRLGLAGDKAGIAIWSAKRLGEAVIPHLLEWMRTSDEEHLRRNSALALGLLGSREAIPVLREMALGYDSFVSRTSRKYNSVRGYAAVYLLGKLGDGDIVPDLLDIMLHPERVPEAPPENSEFIVDSSELYFQYFSHALMSLIGIGRRHPELQPDIRRSIRDVFAEERIQLRISLKGFYTSNKSLQFFSMKEKAQRLAEQYMSGWDGATA